MAIKLREKREKGKGVDVRYKILDARAKDVG